jgi:hypothetical protein
VSLASIVEANYSVTSARQLAGEDDLVPIVLREVGV